VTLARILTHNSSHCLILTVEGGDLVAVKSGFSSGYSGTGAHAFSSSLALLYAHGAEIEEHEVDKGVLERVDQSALTLSDISRIERSEPVRPSRFGDYIFKDDFHEVGDLTIWRRLKSHIPFGLMDARILDLAVQFAGQPDDCLLKGYRRLEDYVRERTQVDEHGYKLFSQVFLGKPPKLTWKDIDEGEHVGRASLFTGTYLAYRNPRAHREPTGYANELTEFLLLNHLFLLENEAVDEKGRRRKPESTWESLRKEAKILDWRSKWKVPKKKVLRRKG
jgi:hypothetical protein